MIKRVLVVPWSMAPMYLDIRFVRAPALHSKRIGSPAIL
jgi:hypothetical protein